MEIISKTNDNNDQKHNNIARKRWAILGNVSLYLNCNNMVYLYCIVSNIIYVTKLLPRNSSRIALFLYLGLL